jgi:hypothetical protein
MGDRHFSAHGACLQEAMQPEIAQFLDSSYVRAGLEHALKFILAAIGSVPWVGGFLSAALA